MQITKVALFFFAAMGAVATPIEPVENGLDARAEAGVLVKYTGCPSKIANKRCTKDGAKCTVDTYNNSVDCD
ncbi:uncharacterized protein N7500_009332 [Penicillium coprophilum]|uniref:uncharacterized protein n=1 Tax=Penicillium coprophilum TaxID=36646 RepID=UPI00238E2FC1|nr:uncharacterized protein N7500_009332 [Penicillium coprophilum]KAJ5153893.1 hypothetical protein N7500_009332 [Penicillium coprophilum]